MYAACIATHNVHWFPLGDHCSLQGGGPHLTAPRCLPFVISISMLANQSNICACALHPLFFQRPTTENCSGSCSWICQSVAIRVDLAVALDRFAMMVWLLLPLLPPVPRLPPIALLLPPLPPPPPLPMLLPLPITAQRTAWLNLAFTGYCYLTQVPSMNIGSRWAQLCCKDHH